MKPLRVSLENYGAFETLDMAMPTGSVALAGGNGAGKSRFVNAIDLGLFAGRGELAQWLTTGEDNLNLQLDFEHAGELYRVRRQFSAKGRGKTTLDFEICRPLGAHDEAEHWSPLTRESADATQELIEETLGLSRTTFRASSFIAQKDGAAFTDAPPGKRLEILAEIIGLGVWGRFAERARAELRGCEADLLKTDGLIAGLDEIVAGKDETLNEISVTRARRDQAQAALIEAEAALETAQLELTSATAARETVRAREAEHQAAVEAHARARTSYAAATAAGIQVADKTIELEELAADALGVDELQARLDSITVAAAAVADTRGRRDELVTQIEQRETARGRNVDQGLQLYDASRVLREKADHLEAHIEEGANCDRCGQILGAEAALRAAASFRAEAVELEAKSNVLDLECETELQAIAGLHERLATIEIPAVEDPAPVEQLLRAARTAAEQHIKLTEQVRQLTEVASHADRLKLELTEAQLVVVAAQDRLDAARVLADNLADVEAKVAGARTAVVTDREALTLRTAAFIRAEQQLERIVDAETKLATHRQATELIQLRVDVLKLAERGFGRYGIPVFITENRAIPQIEHDANEYLRQLGGKTAGCRIELRTQRANKSSDTLKDTLDIVIRTPLGDRTYETFSGGEQTRLDLALRLALARLLAQRGESRLLVIDEPEGLDIDGMERLAALLETLTDTFDLILVVSHNPMLSTAFEQTMTVVSDGERSRIVTGAAEPELAEVA